MRRAITNLKSGRARRNPEIAWTLTVEQVWAIYDKQKGRCALTGIPMTWARNVPTNISIDRITPNGSYSMSNVQLVCRAINQSRGALEVDEYLDWCTKVANHAKQ